MNQEPYEYEVDLRDYIAVIWDNKWLILGLTVVAIGAAVGFSISTPVDYQSTATLMVRPVDISIGFEDLPPVSGEVFTPETYRMLGLSSEVLSSTASKLMESEAVDKEPSIAELERRIALEIKEEKGGRRVDAKFTGSSSQVAYNTAKSWIESYRTELTKRYSEEFNAVVEGRLDEVSSKIDSLEEELKDMGVTVGEEDQGKGLSLLKVELKELQNSYRPVIAKLEENELALKKIEAELDYLDRRLEEEPRYIEVQRSLPSEVLYLLLEEELADGELTKEDLAQLSEVRFPEEMKNAQYVNLAEKKTELGLEVESLQAETEVLTRRKERLPEKIGKLELKIEWGTLVEKFDQLQAARDGDNFGVEVIVSPRLPSRPVNGKNVRQNAAVAGVLGLFIGVLVAFFKNYMEGYEREDEQ